MGEKNEITSWLEAWTAGDGEALARLMPLVLGDLLRVARRKLNAERPGHTLEPPALVNELYLRLAEKRKVSWQSRGHFFATMAQEMRRILVDHARRRAAVKKGGGQARSTLSAALGVAAPQEEDPGAAEAGLLALEKALARLAELDSRQAQIVEMRYFAGRTLEEIAAHLGVSTMTVKRDWRSSRLFLLRELEGK